MSKHYYENSLEEIAASLAHEIKNPLSLVKANIDLLELEDSQGKNKPNYKIMRRELDKINEIMIDFLNLTNLDSEKIQFNLSNMVKNVLEPLIISYEEKILFTIISDTEEILINGNENKIRTVFNNILKNAIEAIIPEHHVHSGLRGKIKVIMRCEKEFVEIIIEDNGKGIPSEIAENLATPYFTTKKGGTGLGLYVSQQIIKNHGGHFSIVNCDGGGGRVTIKLPASVKAHQKQNKQRLITAS